MSTFGNVLRAGSLLEATDPRDHISAFLACSLGLTKDNQPIIDANYFLSEEELWYQVACSLIRCPSKGSLLLNTVEHEVGLPSSIPTVRHGLPAGASPKESSCWRVRTVFIPPEALPIILKQRLGMEKCLRCLALCSTVSLGYPHLPKTKNSNSVASRTRTPSPTRSQLLTDFSKRHWQQLNH